MEITSSIVERKVETTLQKENYKLVWTINGFNLMPFIREHPLFGPSIRLGKEIDSTWQLLLSKQRGEEDKLPSLGFKLVKTEDNTIWDVCRYDITVASKDGKVCLEVVKNALAGGEEDLPYKYAKGLLEGVYKNEDGEQAEDDTPVKRKNSSICSKEDYENALRVFCLREMKSSLSSKDSERAVEALMLSPKARSSPRSKEEECGELVRVKEEKETASYSRETCERIDPVLQALFKEECVVVTCDIRYTYMSDNSDGSNAESQERLLQQDFRQLYKSQKFSDVILRAGKKEFHSHKNILCSRSYGFDLLLQEDQKSPQKLDLEVTDSVAEMMLLFMYTGEFDFNMSTSDCFGLYKASTKYDVKHLRDACLRLLDEKTSHQPFCDDCATDEEKFLKLVEYEKSGYAIEGKQDLSAITKSGLHVDL